MFIRREEKWVPIATAHSLQTHLAMALAVLFNMEDVLYNEPLACSSGLGLHDYNLPVLNSTGHF